MNFEQLEQQNTLDEQKRWQASVTAKTNQELAAIISDPNADSRQVSAAKKLLRKRGVKGVPQ